MDAHGVAQSLAATFRERTLNEGNTRHQIIDRLLHEVLGWPRSSATCEDSVRKGYIDYTLWDGGGHAALLIEAKRQGIYFHLPTVANPAHRRLRYIRLGTLSTNPAIAAAVRQAAAYCPEIGCEFACITNGHEFVLFRAFIRGREFLGQRAIAIASLDFFAEDFTAAYNLLSHTAVTKNRSLQVAFAVYRGSRRELHYPKKLIAHYDAMVQSNQYAMFLDPISRRYFGDISVTDYRMMQRCYVPAFGTPKATRDLRKRISDSLTPYFKADGAVDIENTASPRPLISRIARTLGQYKGGDVLILYGGKGAGKSTFLRRLFYFDPPPSLRLQSFPIIVDCLRAPQNKKLLTDFIWSEILRTLDQDHLLEGSIEQLITLFEDRFQLASKQELAGLRNGGTAYVSERNRLVMQWRYDEAYVVKRLQAYWAKKGKGVIIAFDNTDQLSPPLQDHCFLVAQNMARDLGCITIISMREERYCRARTAGVLDAYQNSGYHLTAPDLTTLFERRLELVIEDLGASGRKYLNGVVPDNTPFFDLKRFFSICLRQFEFEDNAVRRLLAECSRDNMRLALQFFSQFISSGYTHVDEMIEVPTWMISTHQIIKPIMIPTRHNYDENKSLIPNVFQYRTAEHGSHFTMLRILLFLRRTLADSEAEFWRVDSLCDEFESNFGMRRDCEASLDVMLRSGLVEANNRLDAYSIEAPDGSDRIYADEVRITTFGSYILDDLSKAFTYLDLVSLDCGISVESLCEQFCRSALKERAFAFRGEKDEGLGLRLSRVKEFIEYLIEEEAREGREYLIAESESIMVPIAASFVLESERVKISAEMNRYRRRRR